MNEGSLATAFRRAAESLERLTEALRDLSRTVLREFRAVVDALEDALLARIPTARLLPERGWPERPSVVALRVRKGRVEGFDVRRLAFRRSRRRDDRPLPEAVR